MTTQQLIFELWHELSWMDGFILYTTLIVGYYFKCRIDYHFERKLKR